MKKLTSAWFILLLTLAQTLFAQGLSKNCVNEFLAIPEKVANFEMQSFLKDLSAEVVNVKTQLKMPFGKPADSKVTSIGITVGCLKTLPENPAQMQAALKDVIAEITKRVANKLEAKASAQGTNTSTKTAGLQSQAKAAAASPLTLKECDAVFNPEKKFCYDGGVYDKCDGMSYNPTTHICSVDVAYRALCDGKQYNPLIQKCENNVILVKCGDAEYNPKTHACKDGKVFAFSKCGEAFYNPETHGCENDVLLPKCEEMVYNPQTHDCSNGVLTEGLVDARDGKKYRIAKIGNQIWMAENLNYDASGKCYDNRLADSNCAKYGRLYNWSTAKTVCPAGWHLPSKSEYEVLDKVVGGEKAAGKKLKSKNGWNKDGNGTDEFDFSALPGGFGYSDGSFGDVGNGGNWWSASENNSFGAYRRSMYYYFEGTSWLSIDKSLLFSVRCLKD